VGQTPSIHRREVAVKITGPRTQRSGSDSGGTTAKNKAAANLIIGEAASVGGLII
jgi:hypothetical protein